MSKRLQVLLNEAEWREIQRAARAQRMTVAEWVRGALRAARRREPLGDTGKKLDVVRAAARHAFPSGDIQQMLAEIERGYLGESPRDLR
jgi:predicted 2-oxoglutarate/Fe(II)-dependent dioxygenase YbiX